MSATVKSSVLVSGLCLLISLILGPQYVYAQKIKYIPQTIISRPFVRVPAVVNPKLPVNLQQHIAKANPVLTRTVTQAVIRQTAIQSVDFPNTHHILPGPQIFQTYIPAWRSELSGVFSPAQLDRIEQTFRETDDWLFETDINGNWLRARSDEWDYIDRFSQLLTEGPIQFTDPQLKTLFGLRSRLDDVFMRLRLQSFILVHGRAPRKTILRDGVRVPPCEYTPTEREEASLARKIEYNIRKRTTTVSPHIWKQILATVQTSKAIAPRQSPAQWLEQARQFIKEYHRFPRTGITRNGKQIPAQEYSEEEQREIQLSTGIRNALKRAVNSQDPVIMQLRDLQDSNRLYAKPKTPQQWLSQVKFFIHQYGYYPRGTISRDGQPVSTQQLSGQELLETQIAHGVQQALRHAKDANDPVIIQLRNLKENNRNIAKEKTPPEWLEELEAFITQQGRLPRGNITRRGKTVPAAEYTAQEKQEIQLANGVKRVLFNKKHVGSPVHIQLSELWNKTRLAAQQLKQEKQQAAREPIDYVERLEQFLAQYGRYPRARVQRNGHRLTALQYTPQEHEEVLLAKAINRLLSGSRKSDITKRLDILAQTYPRPQQLYRTPEQLLEQVEQFIQQHGRYPIEDIHRNGGRVKPEAQTPADKQEMSLARAITTLLKSHDPSQDPTVQQLYELRESYRTKAVSKSPQELLHLLNHFIQTYQRYPRQSISRNGKQLTLSEMTPQERAEKQLAKSIYDALLHANNLQDPTLKHLKAIQEAYSK